jgi:hypothetical protein
MSYLDKLQEHEIVIEVKNTISLETSRQYPPKLGY